MKNSLKLIAGLLAAAMLLPACAQGGETQDTTAPAVTDASNVVTEETTLDPNLRANHFDALPADINFDGAAITCLFRGTMANINLNGTVGSYWIHNDVLGTNNIGDIVSDAVWERNLNVAERLNIALDFVPTCGGSLDGDRAVFKNVVMTADTSYDFFLPTGNASSQSGLTPYMRDIANIPHVDWNSPWWWQFANEELSIDGKSMQFVVGDMLLTNLAQTCIMYFNKDMYIDLYGDADEVYTMVLDGKFTIDKLHELAQGAYKDTNGDGAKNEGDQFGLLWSKNATEELAGWVACLGLELYQRGDDGSLTITMDNERTITAIEKVYALLNQNEGSRRGTGAIADEAKPFSEGAGLFLAARMISATGDELRNMEQEYGLIPMPKLDEEQSQYYAGVHESGTVLCVPKSTADSKMEAIGATLEALCGEAHRTYMDAFLETAMKMKYSRDALSGQCIDLIMAGLTKSVLTEYPSYCNSIVSNCIVNPMLNNPAGFAAAFRKVGPAAEKTWAKAVADLTKG